MNDKADKGTAAHWVLEQCLTSTYTMGLPADPREFLDMEIEVCDTKHAELSPSGADRWMACPGSFQMEKPFRKPPDPGNVRKIVFDEDYAEAVRSVLDYVDKRVRELEEETNGASVAVHIERRVSPEAQLGTKACDGILDIALAAGSHIELIDAKFGAGVLVSATTKQLDLYLLGVLEDPDFPKRIDTAALTIAQPRYKYGPNFDSRFVDVSGDWAAVQAREVRSAIEATKQEPPVLVPSEKACRFCSALGSCSAAAESALNQVSALDGHIPATAEEVYSATTKFAALEPFLLTPGQTRGLLDGAAFLRATLAAIEEHAARSFMNGSAPRELAEAYKLVHANARRRWALSMEETEKRLKRIKVQDPDSGKTRALGKKDILTTELKSATAIERMLKRMGVPSSDARFDAFRALVDKPEGALVLAPIGDPRTAARLPATPQDALENGPDIDAPDHGSLA